MAVKKHELVHVNSNPLDLKALVQYINMMNEQPHYLPPSVELIKNCQDIVKCLTKVTGTEEQLWTVLHSIEEFLLRVINMVQRSVRHDVVTAILNKIYFFISDPQSLAGPATSVVLVVINGLNNETTLSKARWLVQQGENGSAGDGLRAALSCLYRWMQEWHGTSSLGDWVMAYIKALEENNRYDILVEVSLDNLSRLFVSLNEPATLRPSKVDVIFHVLASLRQSQDALNLIAPHVRSVLTNLASDSRPCSRQHLQNIVDIITAMVDSLSQSLKEDDLNLFKLKYQDMISCLECHIVSRGSQFTNFPGWCADGDISSQNANTGPKKLGLLNLGNTCYMNGVLQALLATRQFSTHVMLRMSTRPYWSKMAALFSKMIYSCDIKLSPGELFALVRPPYFTLNNQHDSSEFLGYLFVLLQSYEHMSEINFEYPKQPVLTTATYIPRVQYTTQTSPSTMSSSENENGEPANRRSLSPRPGSSKAGSSTSGKRTSSERDLSVPPKKRLRHLMDAHFPRRESIIDSMFGGVLLTRIECTECHSSSLSRDVFRDLQLAFPDKLGSKELSVQTLLDYYCSKEILSGDNKYQCRDCGGLRDAERSVLIESTPKYLILVLKHFKFEPKLQSQTKLMHSTYHNHVVYLPTVLTQAQHVSYALYSAVVHSGSTLNSGHYYTLAKERDHWHIFNDDVVTLASNNDFESLHSINTPYILFYRRTDVEEENHPAVKELPIKLQESINENNNYCSDTAQQRLDRP